MNIKKGSIFRIVLDLLTYGAVVLLLIMLLLER